MDDLLVLKVVDVEVDDGIGSPGREGTVAWYFGPTRVAARGNMRSSGSKVSSATVYRLYKKKKKIMIVELTDMNKIPDNIIFC